MRDDEKNCYRCGPRPKSAFGIRRRSKDGLNDICKRCKNITMSEYRLDPVVRRRQYDSANRSRHRPEYKARRAQKDREARVVAQKAQYIRDNPVRVKAITAVHLAVRYGRVEKPTACSCGAEGKLYADFADVLRPFEGLRFLCPACKGCAVSERRQAARLLDDMSLDREEWLELHRRHVIALEREGRCRWFDDVDRVTHECVLGHWVRR